MNKKYIIGLVLVLILVIYGISKYSDKQSSNTDTIKIGVIEPLTGDASSYGLTAKNGFSLAIDEINKQGGINGKKIEVVYEDSKCSNKDALSATKKLIDTDKIEYLLGAMCSGEVLAALPATEEKSMIFFGQGSSPEITGKGKYFFRTWPSDAKSSYELANRLVPQYKKIAIITEQTDYAVALGKGFEKNVGTLGGQIVFSESFQTGVKDFRQILSKIKATAPDVIFINSQTGPNAALIAKQARELGIQSQFAAQFFTGDEFVKANPAVNGTIILDFPILDPTRPVAVNFVKNYTEKFGELNYSFVGGQAYDYVYLLKQAIEKAGEKSENIKKYLNDLSQYEGVIGKYSFDENGDVEGVGFSFKKVEGNILIDANNK